MFFNLLRVPTRLSPFGVLSAIVLIYACFAVILIFSQGLDVVELVSSLLKTVPHFAEFALRIFPKWLLVGVLGAVLIAMRGCTLRKITHICLSVLFCITFSFLFGLVKSHLPLFVPFWADPLFTELDFAIHAGNPRFLLTFLDRIPLDSLCAYYMNWWVLPAVFFPALLIAFDKNAQRARQFILLWALCWIGLGNVAATVFMSVGPIFVGLHPDVSLQSYREVAEFLARDDAQRLLAIRDHLWTSYDQESVQIGSGISAFPSVHVAIATLLGLYVFRAGCDVSTDVKPASRRVLIVGNTVVALFIVGSYTVLSVYLAWHYAVDAYASIGAIFGAYLLLRRRSRSASGSFALQSKGMEA